MPEARTALITNDIVVFGLIAATLGMIFWLASGPTPFWKKFFRFVPALLLCYFVHAVYNTTGLIDGSQGAVYNPIASRVLLPVSLVLLTMGIDIRGVIGLGPRLLYVYCVATLSVFVGAIVTFQLFQWFAPAAVAGEVWKGMAALGGSWIGGSANMIAVREVYQIDPTLFGQFAVVDAAVGGLWLALLLLLANRAGQIDARAGADTNAIDTLTTTLEAHETAHARIMTLTDLMVIIGIGFGIAGAAHAVATPLAQWFAAHVVNASRFSLDSAFVWVVMLSTVAGLLLSLTPLRRLENAGMTRIGTACLYFLVASIGMQMDFTQLADRPLLILLGIVWIVLHAAILWGAARLVRAPFFYMTVGSVANIGGAATAPVAAAAFHPNLAPVGVLLAAVGLATGTPLAYCLGQILRAMAGQ